MNTIVFPESVVGKESAGAYVRADEARARITQLEADVENAYTCHVCDALRDRCELTKRITELEQQLARYQGAVEVEAEGRSTSPCDCAARGTYC